MLVGTNDVRKNLLSQHEQQPHTIHSIATASGRRKGRGKRGRALDPKRSTSRNRPGPDHDHLYVLLLYRSTSYLAAGLLGRTRGGVPPCWPPDRWRGGSIGRPGLVEGARRRLRAGDEEASGGGVLAGVVHRAGAHVVVRALVRGHHVAGVVLVPLHPLLHVAPFRRAPVVVPARARIRQCRRVDETMMARAR
jgi:hypothetical protein